MFKSFPDGPRRHQSTSSLPPFSSSAPSSSKLSSSSERRIGHDARPASSSAHSRVAHAASAATPPVSSFWDFGLGISKQPVRSVNYSQPSTRPDMIPKSWMKPRSKGTSYGTSRRMDPLHTKPLPRKIRTDPLYGSTGLTPSSMDSGTEPRTSSSSFTEEFLRRSPATAAKSCDSDRSSRTFTTVTTDAVSGVSEYDDSIEDETVLGDLDEESSEFVAAKRVRDIDLVSAKMDRFSRRGQSSSKIRRRSASEFPVDGLRFDSRRHGSSDPSSTSKGGSSMERSMLLRRVTADYGSSGTSASGITSSADSRAGTAGARASATHAANLDRESSGGSDEWETLWSAGETSASPKLEMSPAHSGSLTKQLSDEQLLSDISSKIYLAKSSTPTESYPAHRHREVLLSGTEAEDSSFGGDCFVQSVVTALSIAEAKDSHYRQQQQGQQSSHDGAKEKDDDVIAVGSSGSGSSPVSSGSYDMLQAIGPDMIQYIMSSFLLPCERFRLCSVSRLFYHIVSPNGKYHRRKRTDEMFAIRGSLSARSAFSDRSRPSATALIRSVSDTDAAEEKTSALKESGEEEETLEPEREAAARPSDSPCSSSSAQSGSPNAKGTSAKRVKFQLSSSNTPTTPTKDDPLQWYAGGASSKPTSKRRLEEEEKQSVYGTYSLSTGVSDLIKEEMKDATVATGTGDAGAEDLVGSAPTVTEAVDSEEKRILDRRKTLRKLGFSSRTVLSSLKHVFNQKTDHKYWMKHLKEFWVYNRNLHCYVLDLSKGVFERLITGRSVTTMIDSGSLGSDDGVSGIDRSGLGFLGKSKWTPTMIQSEMDFEKMKMRMMLYFMIFAHEIMAVYGDDMVNRAAQGGIGSSEGRRANNPHDLTLEEEAKILAMVQIFKQTKRVSLNSNTSLFDTKCQCRRQSAGDDDYDLVPSPADKSPPWKRQSSCDPCKSKTKMKARLKALNFVCNFLRYASPRNPLSVLDLSWNALTDADIKIISFWLWARKKVHSSGDRCKAKHPSRGLDDTPLSMPPKSKLAVISSVDSGIATEKSVPSSVSWKEVDSSEDAKKPVPTLQALDLAKTVSPSSMVSSPPQPSSVTSKTPGVKSITKFSFGASGSTGGILKSDRLVGLPTALKTEAKATASDVTPAKPELTRHWSDDSSDGDYSSHEPLLVRNKTLPPKLQRPIVEDKGKQGFVPGHTTKSVTSRILPKLVAAERVKTKPDLGGFPSAPASPRSPSFLGHYGSPGGLASPSFKWGAYGSSHGGFGFGFAGGPGSLDSSLSITSTSRPPRLVTPSSATTATSSLPRFPSTASSSIPSVLPVASGISHSSTSIPSASSLVGVSSDTRRQSLSHSQSESQSQSLSYSQLFGTSNPGLFGRRPAPLSQMSSLTSQTGRQSFSGSGSTSGLFGSLSSQSLTGGPLSSGPSGLSVSDPWRPPGRPVTATGSFGGGLFPASQTSVFGPPKTAVSGLGIGPFDRQSTNGTFIEHRQPVGAAALAGDAELDEEKIMRLVSAGTPGPMDDAGSSAYSESLSRTLSLSSQGDFTDDDDGDVTDFEGEDQLAAEEGDDPAADGDGSHHHGRAGISDEAVHQGRAKMKRSAKSSIMDLRSQQPNLLIAGMGDGGGQVLSEDEDDEEEEEIVTDAEFDEKEAESKGESAVSLAGGPSGKDRAKRTVKSAVGFGRSRTHHAELSIAGSSSELRKEVREKDQPSSTSEMLSEATKTFNEEKELLPRFGTHFSMRRSTASSFTSHLTELFLHWNKGITDECTSILFTAIGDVCRQLTVIKLSQTGIGNGTCKVIQRYYSKYSHTTRLRELYLMSNRLITQSGIDVLNEIFTCERERRTQPTGDDGSSSLAMDEDDSRHHRRVPTLIDVTSCGHRRVQHEWDLRIVDRKAAHRLSGSLTGTFSGGSAGSTAGLIAPRVVGAWTVPAAPSSVATDPQLGGHQPSLTGLIPGSAAGVTGVVHHTPSATVGTGGGSGLFGRSRDAIPRFGGPLPARPMFRCMT